MKDDNGAVLIVGAALGFTLLMWWFSRTIGAHFGTTFNAVMWTLPLIVCAGALIWLLEGDSTMVVLSGLLAAAFPAWWKVMDSIAAGGRNPDEWLAAMQIESVWWASGWAKFSTELLLVALFTYLGFRRLRAPYR